MLTKMIRKYHGRLHFQIMAEDIPGYFTLNRITYSKTYLTIKQQKKFEIL